jgi:hypothetical protein
LPRPADVWCALVLDACAAPRDQAGDEQQHHRADEGDEQAPQVEAADAGGSHQVEDEAADDGPDDADDDVANKAQTCTAHDVARQLSSDATDDDPKNKRC